MSNSKILHPEIYNFSQLVDENLALKSKKIELERQLAMVNNELNATREGDRLDTKDILDLIDAEIKELSTTKFQDH